jgi:hypothetical protein
VEGVVVATKFQERRVFEPMLWIFSATVIIATTIPRDVSSQELADLREGELNDAGPQEPPDGSPNRSRSPIPSGEMLRKAQATVEQVFGPDSRRARTPDMQRDLANRILDTSREEKDAAACYALLQAARQLALKAGSLELAIEADRVAAEVFAINRDSQRLDTLSALCERAPSNSLEPVVQSMVEAIRELMKTTAGLDQAEKLTKETLHAARRSKNRDLQATVTDVLAEIRAKRQSLEKLAPYFARLETDPNDREAALKIGKFLCFEDGRWAEGLPILARAESSLEAAAARAELIAIESDGGGLVAATHWQKAFESALPGEKEAIGKHAIGLYTSALGTLSGLRKTKVEKAIEDIHAAIPKSALEADWFVIFRSADPRIWNTATNLGRNRLAVPLQTAPEGIRFLRMAHESGDAVFITMSREKLGTVVLGTNLVWSGEGQNVSGATVFGIGRRDSNITGKGGVAVFVRKNNWLTGYGFGLAGPGKNPAVWAGKSTPGASIEIAVTSRLLTREEQQKLLDFGHLVPAL